MFIFHKMLSRLWTKSEVLMNGTIRISLYRSTRSRLVVAVGDVPGPMVKGCISFVTETDCDDGLPHTLEHLVFMGSKKYPFKGVLDIIANRCLASGTNAWTSQDHTAYTLNTVGSEGFFKVLPVYLNHLLSPMLSDAQFATEVHHINGKGEDAGVVYSEMQDHESEMASIMERRMKEVLYPKNNSYRVDTGGRLKNLRETCTADRVRDFHKKFYHLSNMMVIVSGRLDHERLLKIVGATEEEHLPHVPTSFQRPFTSLQLKPPVESSEHHVTCPNDDESRGIVEISWFGYEPTNFKEKVALDVLFDYMSNTPVSPLQREFVLTDKPLASQVGFQVSEQTTCVIQLTFSGVPTERLDDVKKKFMDKIVKEHVEDKAWDMERMGFLIGQTVKNELQEMEKHPDTELFGHMIGHQLYDKNEEQLKTRVNELELIRRLRSEPASFWSGLVKKYFTKPHVAVIGIPSEKMVEQVAKEEKARLEQQRQKLGKEGIKSCGEKICCAMEENTSRKPDAELLQQLIVKKLEAFDRFPVDAKCNVGGSPASQSVAKFLEQFPFPTTVHNCPTKFVELFLLLDSSALTVEQRAWLCLYNDLLFESPAMINGELKSAEDVAKLYTKDLVDHSIQVGISNFFDKLVDLRIVVDAETGFPNLAKWAEIFTTGIVFDAQRVKQCAKKLASDAREKKRDGCSVASTALITMINQQNTNAYMYDELVLEKFHEKIARRCDSHPAEVVAKLEEGKSGESVDPNFVGRQSVLGVGGSESSFIYQTCQMDCDWMDEELVPTMLLTQYLSQCEGDMESEFEVITAADLCAQPVQAYEQTKKIVNDLLNSGLVVESEFEAAKRSLICELMQREETVSGAGKLSIIGHIRGSPPDYRTQLCKRVWTASADDMIRLGGPRVANLFEKYARAIAVHPSKIPEIKSAFESIKETAVSSLNFVPPCPA
ncbi:hypothetical protein RB195_012423 [Necator americanus]|uniref:Peptidase M16 inactive domain protein n=1 Tax=Necator americanus TaxID=51031 RepID=A0ABR1D703_NECAM